MWTTAAKVADRLLVLARTDKNVEKKHQGLTLFFVDAKSPGITASLLPKLGMRAMGSCEVHYEDVFVPDEDVLGEPGRSEEHTSELQSLMRISYAFFCLKKINKTNYT